MFIINYDHLESRALNVTSMDYDDRELHYSFRLYDDDGVLYFEGRSNSATFDPLDDYGIAFGCTEIRYLRDGVWEQL